MQFHSLLRQSARSAAAMLLAFAFFGCQSMTGSGGFPNPGPDWKTYQGQLHYTSSTGRSVIGDVVIRRSPQGDFQLEFFAGSGIPLIRLWEAGQTARAEGLLARGSWQGSVAHPPRALEGWVALPGRFSAHGQKASVSAGGDRFVFHFSK